MTYVPDEIIIKLKGTVKDTLDLMAAQVGVVKVAALFKESPRKTLSKRGTGPGTILKLSLKENSDVEAAVQQYQSDPRVEYAQPNYIHQIHFIPNDPDYTKQWALQKIGMEQAWEYQQGSKDVLMAIIDTGIDYEHEDLKDNLWINPGEDLNGNDQVDVTDFNGLDDDGNGFVDDLRGWDFTDAPHFPDGGDYLTQDNDPMDEHGHGTSVAGIVGAVANNGIGIAGLAFGCQIMNLRAGTSRGLLEEDDVASAIVYAVDNGARVINMSFGDVVASPLLRDIINYAYGQNCVLVASAGNSSSDQIHYPSGFSETISVGATDSQDFLASFSNYGSTLDVVAPGVDILTTKMGGQYDTFGGTSASAPFVSGLAALLLSQNPALSNEEVKGILVGSTDDLGEPGWDSYYGAGRINALRALQVENFSLAEITFPKMDQGFAGGVLTIVGTATGALLASYSLA
ncbi:MAG: S8 family serine peptidase, partial [candidate division KSB1 bacterium]|nr:S8 family serine peptidase [candidate division KSB1 bacterium]